MDKYIVSTHDSLSLLYNLYSICRLEGDKLIIENYDTYHRLLKIDLLTDEIKTVIIRNINCQEIRFRNKFPPLLYNLELENLPRLMCITSLWAKKITFRSDLPSLIAFDFIADQEIVGLSLLTFNFLFDVDSYNRCLSIHNLYKREIKETIKYNIRFVNYKVRLEESINRLRRLIIASKIKKYWFSFFYSQKRDGINRFCWLSQ